MGYRFIESKSERFTVTNNDRSVPIKFRDMTPAPGDKPVKDWTLKALGDRLRDGTYFPPNLDACKCKSNGVVYRVNGKHNSHVLSDKSIPLPAGGVGVNVNWFEADTLDDVADLYTSLDDKRYGRSPTDIALAQAARKSELIPVIKKNKRLITTFISGFSLSTLGIQYSNKMTPTARAKLATQEVDAILFLASIWCYKSKRPGSGNFFVNSVVAVVYETYKHDEALAREFWLEVRDATNPDVSSSTRKLSRWLDRNTTGGANVKSDKNRSTWTIHMDRCREGWKEWLTERSRARRRSKTKTE